MQECMHCVQVFFCEVEAEKMEAQSFLCRNLKLDIYVIHFCCKPTHKAEAFNGQDML